MSSPTPPPQTPSAPSADPSSPAAPSTVISVAPASPPPATALPEETLKALQAALASEHAAIWTYGLVAAANPEDNKLVEQMRAAHLVRRDAASQRISAGQGTPVPAAPAYSLPKPPTDAASARTLAASVESDCAAAWYAVIGNTDDVELRRVAATALSETAVRVYQWKKRAGATPLTIPFPGQPKG